MATCCVVGATGYVGSYVTRELLKKGYHVRATCRDPTKAQWLKTLVPDEKIELFALTLTPEGFPAEDNPLDAIVSGCKGVTANKRDAAAFGAFFFLAVLLPIDTN